MACSFYQRIRILGLLELGGVTENCVQSLHSSRVGVGKPQPVAQSDPPSVSVKFSGCSRPVPMMSMVAFVL